MADKVYGFDETGFRRVQEATRRTLGAPRVGSQRRRQVPVITPKARGTSADTAPWTIAEYDPATGDVIKTWDRGRPRGQVFTFDSQLLWSSDGYLISTGGGHINRNTGNVIKWNVDAEDDEPERIWESDQQTLHAAPDGGVNGTRGMDNLLIEASDGYIWRVGGTGAVGTQYIARHDPDSGAQTHEGNVGTVLNGLLQIEKADNDGGVVVGGTAALSGHYLHVLDNTATKTAGYGTAVKAMVEHGGRLYLITGATGNTLTILNAADLSAVDSRTLTGTEIYASLTTDGTTVWTTTTATSPTTFRYRAYDATNLATEQWNATRDTAQGTSWRLIYANSYLYDFSETVRKIDPANGSEVWQATSAAAGSTVPRRMTGCLVTATYIVKIDITSNENIFCINESDGSAFWRDTLTANQSPNAQAQSAIVSPDGRLFLCTRRTMP